MRQTLLFQKFLCAEAYIISIFLAADRVFLLGLPLCFFVRLNMHNMQFCEQCTNNAPFILAKCRKRKKTQYVVSKKVERRLILRFLKISKKAFVLWNIFFTVCIIFSRPFKKEIDNGYSKKRTDC